VRDAEVEDQAPAASGVPQVVADLNVAAPLSRAGGDAELRAAEGSVLVRRLVFQAAARSACRHSVGTGL